LTARTAGSGIVEEHHDPIARELVERAFKLADEPQNGQIAHQSALRRKVGSVQDRLL
jgi:hypothetical protein